MRKPILLLLLGASFSAHAANIQYDLSWVLANQTGSFWLAGVGLAAMLVLRRRQHVAPFERRRSN